MTFSPFVQKVFDDIAGTAEFKSYANPQYVRQYQERMCAIIEETIDAPAAQKEAMMAAVLLGIGGAPFVAAEILYDEERMKTYGEDLARIVQTFNRAAPAPAMADLRNAWPAAPIQLQLGLVILIAADEDFAETTANSMKITPGVYQSFIDTKARVEEKLSGLGAPKLAALYNETQKALFKALDAAVQKQSKNTPQP